MSNTADLLNALVEELVAVNQDIGQQAAYTVELLELYQQANALLARIGRIIRERPAAA